VHIQSESRGQGIGNELMKSLIARARALEKHTMIAAVDSGNAASLRFFEAIGFERVAHLKEVGFKFNRFLDLVLLQYRLTPPKGEQG
jgi:phosphinothricin acetyltransferase